MQPLAPTTSGNTNAKFPLSFPAANLKQLLVSVPNVYRRIGAKNAGVRYFFPTLLFKLLGRSGKYKIRADLKKNVNRKESGTNQHAMICSAKKPTHSAKIKSRTLQLQATARDAKPLRN